MDIKDTLKSAYELETRLFRLSLRSREIGEAVKQAKFDLREARIKQAEYNGFRALWDKAAGRYEGKMEELNANLRRAEEKLEYLLRQQRDVAQELAYVQEGQSIQPPGEERKAAALAQPETARLWAQLECRLCAEKLAPLLEMNEKALLEYRSFLRGEYPMLSAERQQEICAEPDIWAQQCAALLERMQEPLQILEMALEIPPYYQSPIFFLMYAAAKHNRMDRASQALDQVLQIRKQVRRILEALDD